LTQFLIKQYYRQPDCTTTAEALTKLCNFSEVDRDKKTGLSKAILQLSKYAPAFLEQICGLDEKKQVEKEEIMLF
jgi:hypothetical protein